ncbi:MAG: hypothetical protein ACFFAN_02845 [Promethearchaeota archaeon]
MTKDENSEILKTLIESYKILEDKLEENNKKIKKIDEELII